MNPKSPKVAYGSGAISQACYRLGVLAQNYKDELQESNTNASIVAYSFLNSTNRRNSEAAQSHRFRSSVEQSKQFLGLASSHCPRCLKGSANLYASESWKIREQCHRNDQMGYWSRKT